MSLLTPAQRNQIRAVLGEVTDTFFLTEIRYSRKTTSLDAWQEDRNPQATVVWTFKAMVTPTISRETLSRPMRTASGIIDEHEVVVTVAMKDLKLVPGAVSNDGNFTVHMRAETDSFSIGSETQRYRVIRVSKHGPLDTEDVLVKIYGQREEIKL